MKEEMAEGMKETKEQVAGAKEKISKKATYAGAGIGLVLFAIFGLLPGSFLGGVMGLNIAGLVLGTPVSSGVFPRVIVGLSMLVGVLASGIIFVFSASLTGWLFGTAIDTVIDTLHARKPLAAKEENTH